MNQNPCAITTRSFGSSSSCSCIAKLLRLVLGLDFRSSAFKICGCFEWLTTCYMLVYLGLLYNVIQFSFKFIGSFSHEPTRDCEVFSPISAISTSAKLQAMFLEDELCFSLSQRAPSGLITDLLAAWAHAFHHLSGIDHEQASVLAK